MISHYSRSSSVLHPEPKCIKGLTGVHEDSNETITSNNIELTNYRLDHRGSHDRFLAESCCGR